MRGEGEGDVSAGLFQDPDFPPDDSSLFSDCSTPLAQFRGDIAWLRPQEMCRSPSLVPVDSREGHAKQGILGDCWFLCACTVLLENRHLMDQVLPPGQPQWGQSGYRGSFLFRLWQHGRWTDVTVDDRLPCVGAKLCFSRCIAPNAFWVALLEKAYAKLQGSYERLWAGQVSEALVDLTGGLAERWSLGAAGTEEDQDGVKDQDIDRVRTRTEEDQDRVKGQDSDRVRTRTRRMMDLDILQALREGGAVSCSTHSAPGGAGEPGQYHALSVTEWLDVRTESGRAVRLLRVRNPWGRRCWGGAWIEGGPGWASLDPTSTRDLLGRAEEGEVWLDQAEFLSRFDDITVGYPISTEGHLQSIYTGKPLTHRLQLSGRWVRGHSAGGCRNCSSYGSNPKFWLRVSERAEVLVSLLQHRRTRRTGRYTQPPAEGSGSTQHQQHQAIGLHMWKVEKRRFSLARTLSKPPCASTPCHAYQRDVVLHTHLEAGHHLLVPSCFSQGAEASFLIRVFSSAPASLSALKAPGPSLPWGPEEEWESSCFHGAWVTGSSAGGSRNFPSHWRNPRFPVVVGDDMAGALGVNVRVTLRQDCPETELRPIGFHLYKAVAGEGEAGLTVPREEEPVASCVPHCFTQDVTLACSLPPETYVIVPSTYQPDCPGQFTLTVARRIPRRVVRSQEHLGRTIQEVSHISVMSS